MRIHLFLATSLLAFLFSCSTKKEQEELIIQSLTHEVLMGDEYLIGKINDMALINDSIPDDKPKDNKKSSGPCPTFPTSRTFFREWSNT